MQPENATGSDQTMEIDAEANAIATISKALSALDDEAAKKRVLEWAWSKYSKVGPPTGSPDARDKKIEGLQSGENGGEIRDVACLTPEGEFKITARDLKAKSANDAAIRLAHVVIFAYTKLKGDKAVSSRKVLVPVMKEW